MRAVKLIPLIREATDELKRLSESSPATKWDHYPESLILKLESTIQQLEYSRTKTDIRKSQS